MTPTQSEITPIFQKTVTLIQSLPVIHKYVKGIEWTEDELVQRIKSYRQLANALLVAARRLDKMTAETAAKLEETRAMERIEKAC